MASRERCGSSHAPAHDAPQSFGGVTTRYIALLRAINVGNRYVKMDRLRSIVQGMGFERVATFIASGNVLFDADEQDRASLEQRIEHEMRASLGFDVATFVRTPVELAKVAAHKAFRETADAAAASLYVLFLRDAPTAAVRKKLLALETPADELHVHGPEVYWRHRPTTDDTRFSAARLEKTSGMPGTMRNITTVRRLVTAAGDRA